VSEVQYPVGFIDDGSGVEIEANIAGCACSNVDPENADEILQDTFYVFWDSRFNPPHLHIQCYDCAQAYCPYQLCIPPLTAEIF
jgi:hypothetical protein